MWVSITGTISGHGQFCVSRLVPQPGAAPFEPETIAANISGFVRHGSVRRARLFQELRLAGPLIRQLSLIGLLPVRLQQRKATVGCRASVEGNG